MTVFLDASILFASVVRSDGRHQAALQVLVNTSEETQITTDHVLVETWILLAGRRRREVAMSFWLGLRHTPIHIENVIPIDLERAEAIAHAWPDQGFDLVDCTSFAVLERLGCDRVASFDKDFAIYRTGPDRSRAFEIVRP